MSAGGFDFNINASGQIQFIKRFDRLSRGLHDVDQTLVSSDLELLPSFLVNMRAGLDRVSLDASWQRNWTVYHGISPFGGVNNIHCTLIQNRVIVCFHSDANNFVCLTSHGQPPGNFPFPIAK